MPTDPTIFGTLVGLGGAVLALVTALVVALIRKPVTVTDLWNENRNLRNDMNAMDLKFTKAIKDSNGRWLVVGEGFIALSDTVEKAKVQLVFTPDAQQKIQAARTLLASDLDWQTVVPD